jgi:6-phosphofructokinase 1
MDTTIETLGTPRIDSPLKSLKFMGESERVLYDISVESVCRDLSAGKEPESFMRAGPRSKIFFDCSKFVPRA